MTDPAPEQIQAAAYKAVELFLSEIGNDFSTGRFCFIAESVDEEGERGLWMAAPDTQKSWETLGLLAFAQNIERNADEGDSE